MGDAARNTRVNPTPRPDEDLLPFFSRRIGLTGSGREIPILAGARLTGRLAGLGIGALSVQTRANDETPANNFAVLRLRRNVLGHSDIGAILLSRQNTDSGGDWNRVYGIDSNIRLLGRLDWPSYFLRSSTPGFTGGQYAARSTLNWEGNFFHGKGGLLSIGEGFNDELGYYRRTGVRKWFMDVGIRPRFRSLQRWGVQEMHPHLVWDYFEDQSGRIAAKVLHSGYTFFLNSGGFFELSANPRFERIETPFVIQRGAPPIPSGSYGWNEWKLFTSSDPSRRLSLSLTGFAGGLWSGTQRTLNGTLTLRPSFHFRMALGMQA